MVWRLWAAGEKVPADLLNNYVQYQTIAVFDSVAQRDGTSGTGTGLLAAPKVGQLTYAATEDKVEKWDGAGWDLVWPTAPLTAGGMITGTTILGTVGVIFFPAAATIPAAANTVTIPTAWLGLKVLVECRLEGVGCTATASDDFTVLFRMQASNLDSGTPAIYNYGSVVGGNRDMLQCRAIMTVTGTGTTVIGPSAHLYATSAARPQTDTATYMSCMIWLLNGRGF